MYLDIKVDEFNTGYFKDATNIALDLSQISKIIEESASEYDDTRREHSESGVKGRRYPADQLKNLLNVPKVDRTKGGARDRRVRVERTFGDPVSLKTVFAEKIGEKSYYFSYWMTCITNLCEFKENIFDGSKTLTIGFKALQNRKNYFSSREKIDLLLSFSKSLGYEMTKEMETAFESCVSFQEASDLIQISNFELKMLANFESV